MPEIVNIATTDLLLDEKNPRLSTPQGSQLDAALELALVQGDSLIRLATDIVENGVDPMTLTAVVATGDRRKQYKVLEGNRRLVALKALETPALISPALTSSQQTKLTNLAKRYAADPVESVPCVLFDTEDEADHWVTLRHTGQNAGVGLLDWNPVEKARYEARHGTRKPALQVLDFIEARGTLSDEAKNSSLGIMTNVERILGSPYARAKLGVDVQKGEVIALHDTPSIAKSLSRVVEDLKVGRVKVPDLYTAEKLKEYVDGLPTSVIPKKASKLAAPVLLDDVTAGVVKPKPAPQPRRRRRRRQQRTTVIPSATVLNVASPRVNSIYVELSTLNAEQYPNACSVLLRVFIELSVDHVIEDKKLMTDAQMRNTPLAKRLKVVVDRLEKDGKISAKLATAMRGVADAQRNVLAAPLTTFNQYVHNQYVFPKAADLYVTWDEISPFMEKVWP